MLKGVICCLCANFLFGLGYYFAVLLRPLNGEGLFGFRIVVLIPFILTAILLFNQAAKFRALLQKIRQNPPLVGVILLLAADTGVQLWLFVWAPNNGQAMAVSIGYLLLPLVTVALGKIVFKETFSWLKWLSLGFAALGVGVNIALAGALSWATLLAALGYPIYITLRRYFQINNLATLLVELTLILPFALYFIGQTTLAPILTANPNFYFWLALFGLVNGAAFILYIASSNLLPVNVLGLLGYVEPLVMLVVSFLIGETHDTPTYWLMACLFVAFGLLSVDNFRKK